MPTIAPHLRPPDPTPPASARRRAQLNALRRASGLRPRERADLHRARFDLLDQLADLERQLADLIEQRLAVIDELADLREQLWPRHPRLHTRRPPTLDRAPVPPIAANARPLHGRHLRHACLNLLARYGPSTLTELHANLHIHGFSVEATNPVKALAEAMRYEVRLGRAQRTARATYATATGPGATRRRRIPAGSQPGPALTTPAAPPTLPDLADAYPVDPDPDEHDDPGRWWHVADDEP